MIYTYTDTSLYLDTVGVNIFIYIYTHLIHVLGPDAKLQLFVYIMFTCMDVEISIYADLPT